MPIPLSRATAVRLAAGATVLAMASQVLAIAPAFAQVRIGPEVTRSVTEQITKSIHTAIESGLHQAILDIDRAHVPDVNAIALSPDAGYMVTALSDGSARIWDLALGREIKRIDAHAGGVLALAISPDGRLIATAGKDGNAALWDRASGARRAALAGHEKAVLAIAFSPDGTFVVTAGADKTARLWDGATGRERLRLEGHDKAVTGLAVTANGARVLTASEDRTIRVWDAATGESLAVVKAHRRGIRSMALSHDGATLITGGENGTVRIWDLTTGKGDGELADIDDPVTALAFSPDDRLVAIGGADRAVRVYDLAGRDELELFEGHGDTVTFVAFGAGGQVIHSASLDGTARVWDRPRKREVAKLISSDDGWTVINETGQFDGSVEGFDAVRWDVEDEPFDLEQFAETYYEPGLLARAVAREPAPVADLTAVSDGIKLPPEVKFVSPKTELATDNDQLEVAVMATDRGGGIAEIRLYHNGKRIDDSQSRAAAFHKADQAAQQVKTVTLRLAPGDNRIEAVALSEDHIESPRVAVAVALKAPARASTLHLFIVGVNDYKNPALNLNYGVPDATAIDAFFTDHEPTLFKEVSSYTLYNDQATRAAIMARFEALRDTAPEDVVVIYFAGHGTTVDDGWYFLPYELIYPEKEQEIKSKGLSADVLRAEVQKIGARKVLMLMDSCKSGAALLSFRGFEERKALSQLARAAGIHVVAAAGKDQFAAEVPELGHGVFTYAILEGLNGAADGTPNDGVVTIRELLSFVESELPDISMKYKAQAQYPVVDSRGQNFPLVALNR